MSADISHYMTPLELKDLTGLTQSAAQIRWLKANGIEHFVRVDGKPRVPKDEKGHPIRANAEISASRDPEPNFAILRSVRLS